MTLGDNIFIWAASPLAILLERDAAMPFGTLIEMHLILFEHEQLAMLASPYRPRRFRKVAINALVAISAGLETLLEEK